MALSLGVHGIPPCERCHFGHAVPVLPGKQRLGNKTGNIRNENKRLRF
jgi:hypothetical protein